ncbi:hypothetical protein [Akkermansia sp.]
MAGGHGHRRPCGGSAIHYRQQHMKEEANVSLPAFGDEPGSPDKETEE